MTKEQPKNYRKKTNNKTINPNYYKALNGTPRLYSIHLRSANDIRRLLSVVINSLRRDEMESLKARTIIYGCSVLLNVIETATLEERLKKIEEAVGARR